MHAGKRRLEWSSNVSFMKRVMLLAAMAIVAATCTRADTATTSVDRVVASVPGEADGASNVQAVMAVTPTAAPQVQPSPTPLTIPPTPTPLPIETRSLVFTGDVLSHTPVIAQALRYGADSDLAYDYRPMFAELAPRLQRADLAICVLETPVSDDNIGLDGYPTFEAPRELPDALVDAGYNGCSTASNHSMDRGAAGVRVTLDQMDRVGLGHAGMARSEVDWRSPRMYDVGGVVVAHLSYSYSLNGFRLPDDEPWLVNLNDVESIVAEAVRARAAGADLVVLSIQWGNEYQREPSDEQQVLSKAITASEAVDLIVGNHVHVVQPVATVNDVPVIFGLGNSLSNQSDNCCRTGTQDGVLIEATIQGNADLGYSVSGLAFAPTWVDRTDFTIVDLLEALEDPDLDPAVRSIYEASVDRTVEAVHSLGWTIPLAE